MNIASIQKKISFLDLNNYLVLGGYMHECCQLAIGLAILYCGLGMVAIANYLEKRDKDEFRRRIKRLGERGFRLVQKETSDRDDG